MSERRFYFLKLYTNVILVYADIFFHKFILLNCRIIICHHEALRSRDLHLNGAVAILEVALLAVSDLHVLGLLRHGHVGHLAHVWVLLPPAEGIKHVQERHRDVDEDDQGEQ